MTMTPEKKREHNALYRLRHPEKIKANNEKYRLLHPDYTKNWDLAHIDQVKANHKRNQRENLERAAQYTAKYREEYPDKVKISRKKYNQTHPEKLKEEWKKKAHRRQRELGFIPINSYFPESNAHHIDSERVIYIPKPLHLSIPHDQKKPDSMKKINLLA